MLGVHRQGIQLEIINFIGDDINPHVGIKMPLGGIMYHIYLETLWNNSMDYLSH